MPRYYFDIVDGSDLQRDEDGLELADHQEALDEARRAMGDLAREFILGGALQKDLTIWVRSQDGTALAQLGFSFAEQQRNPVALTKWSPSVRLVDASLLSRYGTTVPPFIAMKSASVSSTIRWLAMKPPAP